LWAGADSRTNAAIRECDEIVSAHFWLGTPGLVIYILPPT